MKKRVAILGSTGSIGCQTLEVIRSHPDLFEAEVLTAQDNCELLIAQAMEFRPNAVVIGNRNCYNRVVLALEQFGVKVYTGAESMAQVVEMEGVDLVLSALVGYAGLKPTLNAIRAGKEIALANKETLVVAGDLVMSAARENRVLILPVDSEHSAIFQCLTGEVGSTVEKIYLTASGGPFLGKSKAELETVTVEAALRHPNWKMGNKVTIDSASMMNKGLEVIEAHWLFNLAPAQIEVVIHPQSIIHSMVQFMDGSVKAQLGVPDMRLPILFALSYPHRIQSDLPRLDFTKSPSLTFEQPDLELFRNLQLAYDAMERGGNMACILNAANEVAVDAFLKGRVAFAAMPDLIEHCMQTISFIKKPMLEEYIATHNETLAKAEEYLHRVHHH